MSSEINAGQLRSYIERIERLEEEKKELSADIKEVYLEAKGNGFHTKTIRKIVALNKMKPEERKEEEEMLEIYLNALWEDTPLGARSKAARPKAESETAKTKTAKAQAPKSKASPDRTTKAETSKTRSSKSSFKAEVGAELRKAVGRLGKPVALTDEEKRQGMSAAFEKPDGNRLTLGFNVPVGAA